MQPNYISLANLFGVQSRYTVPLFQRPYVWSKEAQWEPLWDDLAGLFERVLTRSAEKAVAGHFLGTVVLEQAQTPITSLPRREVIDGQQRLTTLQILLKAAEHALALLAEKSPNPDSVQTLKLASEQIGMLTRNLASTEEESFKVWPTNEDRAPFKAVMTSKMQMGVAGQSSRMGEAYSYFRETFLNWMTGANAAERAQALASGLKDHLRLIVLDLDDSDEPQAIFETLNAHGTPLLPADLIKNWVLWEGTRQKTNIHALYEEYWKTFDSDAIYWREEIGTGHAARPRIDLFFQNWLTKHTRQAISTKHIYDKFLRFSAGPVFRDESGSLDVELLLSDIRDDGERFRQIQQPVGSTRFATFLRRMQRLDVVVFYPVLLALMGRAGSDETDRDAIAEIMESYLVRRMICNQQTRGYGTLALTLLETIKEIPDDEPAAETIAQSLAFPKDNALYWPDDEMFLSDWQTRRFYGSLRKDRVLMLLQAIEENYQKLALKSEPILFFDYAKLQIEHIMPQSWQQHWPIPEGQSHAERDYSLQGIGNLALVSEKLNPSLSNAPWIATENSKYSKRAGLEQSQLHMNSYLIRDNPEHWNETTIRNRAKKLFEQARSIWPK